MYEAENMTKCPLTRGNHQREVSVSGGSTVFCIVFNLVVWSSEIKRGYFFSVTKV